MGKILIEICLISARGLHRASSLFKLQRYAVGWIDPKNKYCTKIDASGNANPKWETKFSTTIDTSDKQDFNDLVLNVEVYSREPVFLREKLLGTTSVVLKEFIQKYLKIVKTVEEKGSFQLRKKNSNAAQGFVDLSIRISEEREEASSYSGGNEGIMLMNHINLLNLNRENGAQLKIPQQKMEIHPQATNHYGQIRPLLRPIDHSNTSTNRSTYASQGGTSYPPPPPPPPPRTPPPPPLPLNGGYTNTFSPMTGNVAPSDMNFPSTSYGPGPGHGSRSGFGAGLGGGALAAGAMIFGDDFASGFDLDVPSGLLGANFTMSTDPPF